MPNEVMLSPSDVVAELSEENRHLRDTVEEQAAELYWSMKNSLAHRGKDFMDVGKKQQQKHLEQIQQVNFIIVQVRLTAYHKWL